jgi:hypothetical protein
MAMMWILFSPISLLGGNSHYNLGAFNDCLWYGIFYMTILATRYAVSQAKLIALSVVALYFDPRLFCIMIAINLLQLECSKSNTDSKLQDVSQ